ncbi:hypothetical protein D8674_038527 [Pyrus ussuriensis x Pyrus communis]|uniref:Uncharacterized protein n=1 Tax=Pyrus ussuriensis x Pyrus communis TaxID=2448454 RepID=A0A5N5FPB0_9ROSA|nr:hypothetical protein D8674_038527 [Pyrus ussuriensis x Pyrus communis]
MTPTSSPSSFSVSVGVGKVLGTNKAIIKALLLCLQRSKKIQFPKRNSCDSESAFIR